MELMMSAFMCTSNSDVRDHIFLLLRLDSLHVEVRNRIFNKLQILSSFLLFQRNMDIHLWTFETS